MPEVFDAVLSHVLLANRTSSPSEKVGDYLEGRN